MIPISVPPETPLINVARAATLLGLRLHLCNWRLFVAPVAPPINPPPMQSVSR